MKQRAITMQMSTRTRLAGAVAAAAVVTGVLPGAAHADEGTETREMAVVMVNFSDSKIEKPEETRKRVQERYFGQSESINTFYDDMTNGRFQFTPAQADQPVIGPVDIPMAARCETGRMNTLVQEELRKQGLDREKGDYRHLSMVFPDDKTKCGWGGLGSVGGPYSWIPTFGLDQTTLSHEIGHNFGFGHQMRLRCQDGDLANCEEDGTSGKTPMGGGGVKHGLTAPEMIHMKWLNSQEKKRLTKSGTYELRSLHERGGTGLRALDVPMGENRLVVEYRHQAGKLDAEVEGVHAYLVKDGAYQSAPLVDLTEEAASAEAPAADAIKSASDKAGQVRIDVTESGEGSATVEVSLNGEPAPAEAANSVSDGSGTGSGDSSDSGGSPKGDEAGDGITVQSDGKALAESGGDSTTPYVAAGGGALVLLGAALYAKLRRRRA
ncbi:LAETG motif-containing sortase-dependent surface protein [Streptomyces oceani]|uniref:Gram-positive cocci surface proteins LPxTG domain-containing protein n=1 Tax=Streptomyces oceani TaxID=1075402 RepID=A0A1E7KMQ5_9ACTN|nr:LAETG motif-containing sortase-dependent surface protein [Streptomyces oceani]OEV05190.1 hypothetical protein AN216_04245 [Streptomyces oceani]